MVAGKVAFMALLLVGNYATAQESGAGWNSAEKPTTPLESEEVQPLSDKDQQRYADVGRQIVVAINAEDENAYRGLFSNEGWKSSIDWVKEMFALQTAKYGLIDRAYVPVRGVMKVGKMGFRGDERNGATMLLLFEEAIGCALSFELNEAGKIVHTSVFIKQELAMIERDEADLIYELARESEKGAGAE